MKIKVVFIDPPHVYLIQQKTQAPMGLMYLAAVLEKEGYEVEIARIDTVIQEQWLNLIPEGNIYGISAVSLDYGTAKDIAKVLKQKRKNSPVIIGGYHVTADLKNVLREDAHIWDAICVGEGEGIIKKVMEDFQNNNLQKVYSGNLEPNLDNFPFPSRHLINEQGSNIFAFDKHYVENRLSTVLVSSRGCPFRCCFCSTQAMWKRKIRHRSAENIIKEIEFCINSYKIEQFRFSDEVFTLNRKRTLDLMDRFKEMNMHWKCSTRIDCVDLEVLRAMREGGCKEIAFGIESADENVLPYLNKSNDIKRVKEVLAMCNNLGINTRVLLMIGTPGERLDTVDKNIKFLEDTPYACASLAVFKPLPGSDVWNNPEKYKVKILSRNLSEYNIYMWVNGKLDENKNEHVVRILTLPSVTHQIKNRKRMIEYFMKNERMNEIKKAKKKISFWIHGIPKEENLYIVENEIPITQRRFVYRELWYSIFQYIKENHRNSLEIGCGRGTISQYLKKRKKLNVSLTDVDIELVKLAKRNFSRINENGNFVLINASSPPFKNEAFDLIVSMGFLEHHNEASDILLEIKRLLCPKGIFICYNAPEKWSIQKLVNILFHRIDYYRRKDTLCDFQTLLKKMGFKILDSFYANPYPIFNNISIKSERIITGIYRFISRFRKIFLHNQMRTNKFLAIGYFTIVEKE